MAAVIGVVLGSSFHPGLAGLVREWRLPLLLLLLSLAIAALLCVTWFRRVAGFDPATAHFAGMPGGIAEMVLTFVFAVSIGRAMGLDFALLALAYSPGGLPEMSMVALSLALEPGVVVVHHLTRVVLVLIAAPLAFRFLGPPETER